MTDSNITTPFDKGKDYIKVIKTNIKSILHDDNKKHYLSIISNLVINTNKIHTRACEFIKFYCIYLYDNNLEIPFIDKEFVCDIFDVITVRKSNKGYTQPTNKQFNDLIRFYNDYYSKIVISDNDDFKDEIETIEELNILSKLELINLCKTKNIYYSGTKTVLIDRINKFNIENKNGSLFYDKMSYLLAYEAIDIVKNINNNIKEHFFTHLNKFVNHSFSKKEKGVEISKIKDKDVRKIEYKKLNIELKNIKDDLITIFDKKIKFKSDKKHHKWIKQHRQFIIPNKDSFDKNSIPYDIESNTQDYLSSFIYIGKQLELLNNDENVEYVEYDNDFEDEDIGNKKYKIRLFNIIPLRTNIIPKHITIDTCGLIQNFLGDKSTSDYYKKYKKQPGMQHDLWSDVFNLEDDIFTTRNRFKPKQAKKRDSYIDKNYKFNYMIKTDGISVSILFIKLDNNGNPLKFDENKFDKERQKPCYIEDETNFKGFEDFVCADPNKEDLIYCASKSKDKNGNLKVFRYTQNQRRVETRKKKYCKIIDKINKESLIEGKTIKEHEAILSSYSRKTNSFEEFKEYLIHKNKLNNTLYEHYKQYLFRKLKLNSYINTQKSESKMIRNFKNKFGGPNKVKFIIGDYDSGSYNMKSKEPAINKRFRRIFKNNGYKVYLVNEYKTSVTCNNCHDDKLETFRQRISKNPRYLNKCKKENKAPKAKSVNGLLRCTNVKECKLVHNRDKNAVQNMIHIVNAIIETGERPVIFKRKATESPSLILPR